MASKKQIERRNLLDTISLEETVAMSTLEFYCYLYEVLRIIQKSKYRLNDAWDCILFIEDYLAFGKEWKKDCICWFS